MREFRTLCRDKVTNGTLILSETTFNSACYWLERKGFECETVRTYSSGLTEIIGTLNGEPKKFFYDENRGYLINSESICRVS